MELDNLKSSWKNVSVDLSKNEFDIIAATKKEMESPLNELYKKMRKQIRTLPIIFSFLVVMMVKTPGLSNSLLMWMGVIIIPVTIIYYYFNINLIKDLQQVSGSVKTDFQRKVEKLIKSNSFYLKISRVIFLILVITIEFVLHTNSLSIINGLDLLKDTLLPVRLVIYAGAIGLHYILSRYTYHHYFGQYLNHLKGLLREM